MNDFWWLVFLYLLGVYGIAFGKKTSFIICLIFSYLCLFLLMIWTIYDPIDLLPHIAVLSLCITTAVFGFKWRMRN